MNEIQRQEMLAFQLNMENKSKIFEEKHQSKMETYFQKLDEEKNSFLVKLEKETHYFLAGLEMKKVLFLNTLKDARKSFYNQEHVNLIEFKTQQENEKSNLILRERSSHHAIRTRKLSMNSAGDTQNAANLAVVDERQRPASLSPIPAIKLVSNRKSCVSAQPSRSNSPSKSRKTSVDMIVEDTLQKLIERAEGDKSYNLSQQDVTGTSIIYKLRSKVPFIRQTSNQSDPGVELDSLKDNVLKESHEFLLNTGGSNTEINNNQKLKTENNDMCISQCVSSISQPASYDFQLVSSQLTGTCLYPTIPSFQPGNSNFQIGNSDFQPASSGFQLGISSLQPASSGCQPASSGCQPIHSNNQLSNLRFEPDSSTIQSVSSNYQPAISDFQPASHPFQMLSSDIHTVSSGFQPVSSGFQPVSSGFHSISSSFQPVSSTQSKSGVQEECGVKGIQYGAYVDSNTGLTYYIPLQDTDSSSCTTTSPSPLPPLEFVTSLESCDAQYQINDTNSINQNMISNIPASMISNIPASMISNIPASMISNIPASLLTNVSSHVPSNVSSSMPSNIHSNAQYSKPLQSNVSNQQQITKTSSGALLSGQNVGQLTGPNVGQLTGQHVGQLTPRLARKPAGLIMEILREEEEEEGCMSAEDSEILSITNSAVGSFNTSESFKSLVGDDFRDENVRRVSSRSSMLSHTSPDYVLSHTSLKSSPEEMFYQEKSLSPEQETLKKVVPLTTQSCNLLFQVQVDPYPSDPDPTGKI